MATIKITNLLTQAITAEEITSAVISPTPMTTPSTPVEDYIADMVTIVDGVLNVPAYNKFQTIAVPFQGTATFEVTDPAEIAYYENLKLTNAKVEVTGGIFTTTNADTDADGDGDGG